MSKEDEEFSELADNEEYISRDDISIEIMTSKEDESVLVRFTGFSDHDEVDAYATFLSESLPLLLFHSTTLH